MGREKEAVVVLKNAAKENGLEVARVDRAIKHFSQVSQAKPCLAPHSASAQIVCLQAQCRLFSTIGCGRQ